MRLSPHHLPQLLISLLAISVLSGIISVQASSDPSSVGANVSVPPAPAEFGYGVNFGNPSGWNNQDLSTVAAKAGANTARIKFPEYHFASWGYDIELTNGNIAAYRSNGMANMAATLIGPTAAHSTSPTGGNLDQYSPKNLYQPIWSSPGVVNPNNYWASYVYNVVSRYKDHVKIWEVWNEPDLATSWSATQTSWWTSPPRPDELPNWHDTIFAYIRLLRITYEVAKAVDPSCFVATGGIGYESFLDAILRYTDNPADGSITQDYPARGGAWFDVVSFHHYPHFATYDQANQSWIRGTDSDSMATSFVARQNTLRMQLDRYGYNGNSYPRKLWIATETGVSSKPVGNLAGGVDLERNYLLKVLVLAQANGVSQVDWFQLADTDADSASSSAYAHMGLYYDLKGKTVATAKLKVAGTASKSYKELILGQNFDAAATASLALTSNVRGYVFRLPDGRKSYVLWAATSGNSETASASIQLPTGVPLEVRSWDYSSTRTTSTLAPAGGKVTINLSAIPIFLNEITGGGTNPTLTPNPTSTLASTAAPTQPPSPAVTPTSSPTPTAIPTQPTGSVSGGERLLNGGFEDGLANWYVPTWFSNVVAADTAQSHGGSRALRFQGSTSGPYAFQEVPASPADVVSFSGWINIPTLNGTMSMVVDLVPRHQYNGDLATVTLATVNRTTTGWVKIEGSAMMPDRTASVRLRIRSPRLDGTAYLDDLSLRFGVDAGNGATALPTATPPPIAPSPTAAAPISTPTPTPGVATAIPTATMATISPTPQPTATPLPTAPAAGQMLANGGFESGLAGWSIPSWFASTASADTAIAHSGSSALRFKGNAAGPYLFQEVNAAPGQGFDFSGWLNVVESYSDSALVVELVARSSYNSNLATYTITADPRVTNGWVRIGGSMVMPNNTAKLRVQVRFPKLHGTLYFDDLYLSNR